MADSETKKQSSEPQSSEGTRVDAVRHVGRTLESEGLVIPTGELPENVIADEGLTETVDMRAVTADEYDLEAEAMGAEPLRTRLPGDTSSDPHTNVGSDNATNLDQENG